MEINYSKLAKNNWSEEEQKNVKLLIGFVKALMNDHNFDEVATTYGNDKYKQHNRGIPEGFNALINYVKDFTKRFPDYCYDVQHVYADGDYVTFHSHITTNKKHRGNHNKGFNAVDIWKVENNEIVEHWDSLQPINGFMRFFFLLIGGKVANKNGLF